MLIAFVLVAAAAASPVAPAADKTAKTAETVKDKRAIYGEYPLTVKCLFFFVFWFFFLT